MPVTLGKATDTPTVTGPAHLHITIAQLPDGRISSVEISGPAPDSEELWYDEPRATVWTGLTPDADDDDRAMATKVLDLAMSPEYRQTNGHDWAEGERNAFAFHFDHTEERAFLRTVEAHLIRAGYLDAHVGSVACHSFGLTLAGSAEHYAYNGDGGWRFATEDCTTAEGAYEYRAPIAPADATPRRVAAAILVHLADAGEIEPAALAPLHRIPVRYGLWRITNWAHFTRRMGQRLDRYRRRITARTR
ncbi:hypothetical protein [Streptomyces tirandamycinicus]|uniref:Uncharacterized protein n=1 Tax=Streptomyces tirandamycinicus TaxID=2174846 RepID=A0A2S1T1U6_9ACTN|nr:hypothetical protein [Streptomyces tirandamycinicus]AWI32645.1 hypothetical protein DDW44_30465 [Streptomyces tirandamycinicus]